MSPLSPEVERELDVLRRRAYGPDADIDTDPEAAGRLDRLERAARAQLTTGLSQRAGVEADAATEPSADDSGARSSWWRHPSMVLAVATIVVSGAVAAGIAYMSAGPRPDASLAITDERPNEALIGNILWLISAYDIDRDTIRGHGEFAEMSVWTARSEDGMRCVFLTANTTYTLATSCTPSGLDPTIDFLLYQGMSDIIGGDYPPRTALRFVGHADAVDVWIEVPRR